MEETLERTIEEAGVPSVVETARDGDTIWPVRFDGPSVKRFEGGSRILGDSRGLRRNRGKSLLGLLGL